MSSNIHAQSQSISTRFDTDTLARLREISQNQKRPRSEIIKEAVNGYLDSMAWFEREVKKGLDDVNAGHTIPHEDLKEELRKLGVRC